MRWQSHGKKHLLLFMHEMCDSLKNVDWFGRRWQFDKSYLPFQTFWSRGTQWRQWGLARQGEWSNTWACSRTVFQDSPHSWKTKIIQTSIHVRRKLPCLSWCVDPVPHRLEGESQGNTSDRPTEGRDREQVVPDQPAESRIVSMRHSIIVIYQANGNWFCQMENKLFCRNMPHDDTMR